MKNSSYYFSILSPEKKRELYDRAIERNRIKRERFFSEASSDWRIKKCLIWILALIQNSRDVRRAQYLEDNKEHREILQKKRYLLNRDKIARQNEIARKARMARDPEVYRALNRANYHRNKKPYAEYEGIRYVTDAAFNLRRKCRRRLRLATRGIQLGIEGKKKTEDFIGCSYSFLKSHIESLFTEGMSWDMVFCGKIHIDHKIPCAAFDFSDPKQVLKCFNYKNLQPLWAKDNLIKNDKMLPEYKHLLSV